MIDRAKLLILQSERLNNAQSLRLAPNSLKVSEVLSTLDLLLTVIDLAKKEPNPTPEMTAALELFK